MEKLVKGALTFRKHVFSAYRDLFKRLADTQDPEALFITCSDSRIVPSLITTSEPGDLFIVRNVGNIVPEQGVESEVAAAIEFAVGALKVQDIIVCGHSGCGAMKAALAGAPADMPNLQRWLRHAAPARSLVDQHYDHIQETRARADLLAQLNVLVQLKHIKTYPHVERRLADGSLHLHGWFFEIDAAQLYHYDPDEEQFVPLSEDVLRRQSSRPPGGDGAVRLSP